MQPWGSSLKLFSAGSGRLKVQRRHAKKTKQLGKNICPQLFSRGENIFPQLLSHNLLVFSREIGNILRI